MTFKVFVTGTSGGYAGAGKACSGYLLSDGDNSLALDLGAGSLGNLLKYLGPDRLGGLAISHLHYDHYMDLYGLCTARRFWPAPLPPLPVLAPPGSAGRISAVISEESREAFMSTLEVTEIRPGEALESGGFEVTALPAEHIESSFIFRIGAGKRSLCYSGDTACCDALLEQARGADLFICEATATSQVPFSPPGHMSAREAGEVAAEAGVGALVLTHVWPTLDGEVAVRDAAAAYDGPVELAVEGKQLFVGPYPVAAT